jgi:uncharacterized protein (DUF1015 family)
VLGEGRVLTAVIPSDHLEVLPFHRRVVGAALGGGDQVAARLGSLGELRELGGRWQPDERGVVAVTVGGRWWALDLRERIVDGPVEGLDVKLVEREVLPVLLDGADPTSGARARVEPVAGATGLASLERDGTIGIALAAPGVEAILEVADAGESMPTKTTYVTPKLRSGIFLTPR